MGKSLRHRILIELFVLGVLTIVFLALFPERPIYIDVLLALFALCLILSNARFTKNSVWAQFPPEEELQTRVRRSYLLASAVTIPVILGLAAIGLVLGYRESGWDEAWARLLNYHLPLAFALYLPWALLQQFLFQFYLLGRLLTLFPAPVSVVTTGMAYSLLHLPDIGITLAAAAAGIFWTFLYRRDRVLLPLGLSHALLGSTFYYWVYGHDLFLAWKEVLK
jgi:hypothetical protein